MEESLQSFHGYALRDILVGQRVPRRQRPNGASRDRFEGSFTIASCPLKFRDESKRCFEPPKERIPLEER